MMNIDRTLPERPEPHTRNKSGQEEEDRPVSLRRRPVSGLYRCPTPSFRPYLRMATAATANPHPLADHANPCRNGLRKPPCRASPAHHRGRQSTVRQARGLTAEAVAAIRGGLNGKADTASGALTLAIVSVMADAGLRCFEAAALEWRDAGSGRVRPPRNSPIQDGSVRRGRDCGDHRNRHGGPRTVGRDPGQRMGEPMAACLTCVQSGLIRIYCEPDRNASLR